ncbi:MAG TPA: hypothetical protein PKK96_01720 [Anaerolineales bacterium]|nr:hypothetical protein [Anaerolineales bacterium]HMS00657.1 hypothetical protein [Anaerolineales bacterium]HNQ96141.1 hypothetical protein [Anaerolineales bacterium]HNS59696.1 hypothetical protein [Anaerolineales bacterium]
MFLTGTALARQVGLGSVLSPCYLWLKFSAAVVGIITFWAASNDDPISLSYVAASCMFIVSMTILLFSTIARLSIVSPWNWVSGVSYASYFIYLFHRPFWQALEDIFSIQGQQTRILFRVLPASLAITLACYFLQRSYDSLVASLRRKVYDLNR